MIQDYSSGVIDTIFDYEDDEGMPYFSFPDKDIENNLLVDSGNALVETKVKVHIEIVNI